MSPAVTRGGWASALPEPWPAPRRGTEGSKHRRPPRGTARWGEDTRRVTPRDSVTAEPAWFFHRPFCKVGGEEWTEPGLGTGDRRGGARGAPSRTHHAAGAALHGDLEWTRLVITARGREAAGDCAAGGGGAPRLPGRLPRGHKAPPDTASGHQIRPGKRTGPVYKLGAPLGGAPKPGPPGSAGCASSQKGHLRKRSHRRLHRSPQAGLGA